jgi:hypothetical protein
MGQPSQLIADRYRVDLPQAWCNWFDCDALQLELAGEFRTPAEFESLLEHAPKIVWPGLMLPDTLPILGNDYGDWMCVRVDQSNRFGELLHWYHGGGDWIPLGDRLAEAVLHDTMDQFRPRTRQVLRGAPEITSPDHQAEVLQRLSNPDLRRWLDVSLRPLTGDPRSSSNHLQSILDALASRNHPASLQCMLDAGWARPASLCDRVEVALQEATHVIASPHLSKQLGINWEPEYVRWLFDTAQIPTDAMHQIQELLHSTGAHTGRVEQQDWAIAERMAQSVLTERSDLGWAFDIAGWAALRRGETAAAAQIFFQGRHASAFSDQSVRMRTHWFDQQFGKFSIAQLWSVRDKLSSIEREDVYLQTVWQTPSRLVQREVQLFWMAQGKEAMRVGRFEDAYFSYYQAGWDLGAQRMTDYLDILAALAESAEAAGWTARAAVAATHLACLSKSLPPRAYSS